MVRISSYSILSDAMENQSKVLLNGCSGALDILPVELAAYFEHQIINNPKGQAYIDKELLHPETYQSLIERGHLTEASHDDERDLVCEIAAALHEQEKTRPCFMIVPNMDCNYRCTYCFERHIQKKLKSKTGNISYHKNNVLMRQENISRIYDGIEKIQTDAGHEIGCMIVLYGGEPLDAANKDLIFDIVNQGSARGYCFAAITNGHNIEEFLPILGNGKLQQVQISIDGLKEVHDKRRIYVGKESSFDKLMININKVIAESTAEVHIRVHVDPANIDDFEKLLALFEAEGWTDHEQVVIYTNTVYEKQDDKVTVQLEVGDIASRLFEIVGKYSNVFTSAPAVHAYHAMTPAIQGSDRFQLKGTYCSANFGNYIFAPDGNIYSCWESIGKDCSKIGNYLSEQGMQLDQTMTNKWFQRNISLINECSNCSYALVCGGGCAQYAEYNNGGINKPYCDDFQRTFNIALADEMERDLNLRNTEQDKNSELDLEEKLSTTCV